MNSETVASFHKKVNRLIENGSLREVFRLLADKISRSSSPALADRLKNLEETYKYMIHYLVEGYADAGRDSMLQDIKTRLMLINDSILRLETLKDSPDVYSSTKRFEEVRKATLRDRLAAYSAAAQKAALALESGGGHSLIKEAEDALSALFAYVWTMFGSSENDYRIISRSVISDDLPFGYKAQMISALMLGSISYFDPNALTALFDIYEAEVDQKLTARALTAILIIVATHPQRVAADPTFRSRLILWKDSIITYRRLREVVMNIIRSRDTQRISSKMKDEVLPELMKLQPEILSKLKNVSEDTDLEMLEVNPEWEEILNKNGLGDKLKELTEMQMDGGDVMMVAFSNLKNFPFFNTVGNWFLPFSSHHSDVTADGNISADSLYDVLNMEGVMCDSDKYSFAFSLAKMPEQQRKMMFGKMDSQMAQFKEIMADRKLKSSLPEFDAEVTRYVRDIYRFFKLFRRNGDFHDPFEKPLDFMSLPVISEILSDDEILNLVGEFYFKRGYYTEALPLLLAIDSGSSGDPLLWEKIGYCNNALNRIDEAIVWYSKAELLNPDSQWLIKKLAQCYRLTGRYCQAGEYYARALESDPDNYSLLMSAAHCLLEENMPEKALEHYYHADYIKPGKTGNARAIAWTEFLVGNTEKSISIYKGIADSADASANDLMNFAHVYMVAGNRKKAAEYYLKSARAEGSGPESLSNAIKADLPILKKAGVNPDELDLILEKVRYDFDATKA